MGGGRLSRGDGGGTGGRAGRFGNGGGEDGGNRRDTRRNKGRNNGRSLDMGIIRTVYRKETVEAFRDRRTMFIMIVFPIIIMPGIMLGIPYMSLERQKAAAAQPSGIVVIGYEATSDEDARQAALDDLLAPYNITLDDEEDELDLLQDFMDGKYPGELWAEYNRTSYDHSSWLSLLLANQSVRTGYFRLLRDMAVRSAKQAEEEGVNTSLTVDFETFDNLLTNFTVTHDSRGSLKANLQRLRDGEIHSVVVVPPDLLEKERDRERVNVSVYYDATSTKSVLAYRRVAAYIETLYTYLMQVEVLSDQGLAQSDIEFAIVPTYFSPEDVSTKSDRGGLYLSLILPMILGIYVVSAGMYTTIDITAGEKERHTLEALLVTPPERTNLVIGKFLTILTITILVIIVTMLSMVASLNVGSTYIDNFENISFELSPLVFGIVVAIFFVLAVMINAVEMAICFTARSFKEAQNYITPLTFAVLVPAILLQGYSVDELPNWFFVIPIFNVLAAFTEVLLGVVDYNHLGLVILTSTVYAVAASYAAIRTFEREDILFRS